MARIEEGVGARWSGKDGARIGADGASPVPTVHEMPG